MTKINGIKHTAKIKQQVASIDLICSQKVCYRTMEFECEIQRNIVFEHIKE